MLLLRLQPRRPLSSPWQQPTQLQAPLKPPPQQVEHQQPPPPHHLQHPPLPPPPPQPFLPPPPLLQARALPLPLPPPQLQPLSALMRFVRLAKLQHSLLNLLHSLPNLLHSLLSLHQPLLQHSLLSPALQAPPLSTMPQRSRWRQQDVGCRALTPLAVVGAAWCRPPPPAAVMAVAVALRLLLWRAWIAMSLILSSTSQPKSVQNFRTAFPCMWVGKP